MATTSGYCGSTLMLYDQACLNIENIGSKILDVYMQSADCYQCSLIWLMTVHPGSTNQTLVSTVGETILKFINNGTSVVRFGFGQHGRYNYTADDTSERFIVDTPPEDAYAPLKIEFWVLFIILTLWSVGACTSYYLSSFRWIFQTNFIQRELLNDIGPSSESTSDPVPLLSADQGRNSVSNTRSGRINFIDAFRGITITLMLFVNYGGGKYWFFMHAPWNGMTIADIVFPSFAFVMGMSLLLSISSLYRITNSRKKVILKVFLRSIVLICLGIMKNSVNKDNLLQLRVLGVLQRLGLAYLIIGTIEALCVQMHFSRMVTGRLAVFQEGLCSCGAFQWMFSLMLLVIHTSITFQLSVPGCPKGYLGPGGLHMNRTVRHCTGGAAGFIDRIMFTPDHMYRQSVPLYHSEVRFDPEGMLGVLTTAFTVFLGVCAIRLYVNCRSPKKLMVRWIILSLLCGFFAGQLCNWSKEDGLIPINKKLWSLSFTLAAASIAFLVICFLYFIIDYMKLWNGSPFKEVGKNALLLYLLSELLKNTFPWRFTPINLTTHTESLLMDTWSTCLWIIIAVILARNEIFIAI